MQSHDSWLKSMKGNFHGIEFLPFHHHPFLSPRTLASFIELPSIASLYMRVSHQPPSPSPASRRVAERLVPLSTKTPYEQARCRTISAIVNQDSLSGLKTEIRKLEGMVKELVNKMIYLKRQEDPTPRSMVRHPLPHLSCQF